jgi:U3 small nucleolar RNA-associated protein 18
LGRDGYILLLSSSTKQWVANLKMNSGVTAITFGPENIMWSLGVDGMVYKWDLSTRACLHTFTDQGSIKGSAIHASPDGKWLAVGSTSGIVNIYSTTDCLSSATPEPRKSVMNLTTAITSILFHPSNDLIFISSKEVKDAMRVVHVPTMRIVKNWPTEMTPLGYVFSVAVSRDGQYLVVGNDKGKAIMYRLDAFTKI